MHYTKVLQSLCTDFFFKSPRGGSHLSCILQNVARMFPQTHPYFLFPLHLNLMSIFCPPHPIASVSAHRLPEFYWPLNVLCPVSRTWHSVIILVTSNFTIFLLVTVNTDLILKPKSYCILYYLLSEKLKIFKNSNEALISLILKIMASGSQFDKSCKCPVSEFFEGKCYNM